MTEKELRAWMRKDSLTDAWFVSASDGHVDPELYTLAQIRARYAADTASAKGFLLILHEGQQNRKDPAWIELDLASLEDAPAATTTATKAAADSSNSTRRQSGGGQSRSSQRNKRRMRGMFLQLILLFIMIAAGLTVWYFATREEPTQVSFISEEEAHNRMLDTLAQNMLQHNPADPTEDGEPIRTVVSATERMLMIKNSNLDAWPSFSLKIITANGDVYTCDFDQPIPAYSTLSISMRKIVTSKGQSLSRDDLKSGTLIELNIPGYKDWSSKL